MKLISCYIENFGGLSQYSREFGPGINVIEEPNGFGKTTLATFIRSMFYGFPRSGKTLDKNDRKKYTPWQGGKYGGNLVFEYEGIRYRVERFFGTVPRQDTFALYQLDPLRKSTRFSQNIGAELFQLDAESFERSTYMPQLHDASSLTTDSIQAKLGNLVEDTNDINNFASARTRLREKRSSLIPYRGQGGAVAQAQEQISRIQDELDRREFHRGRAAGLEQEIQELEKQEKEAQQEVRKARESIKQASRAAELRTLAQQQDQLQKACNENIRELERLTQAYPKGLPSQEELEGIASGLERLAQLQGDGGREEEAARAEEFLARNRERFAGGGLSDETLEAYRRKVEEYVSVSAGMQKAGMPLMKAEELRSLEEFFAAGMPSGEELETYGKWRQRLAEIQGERKQTELSSRDQARLEKLERLFVSGIPSEDTLTALQSGLERAAALRQENERLMARMPDRAQPQPAVKKSRWILPAALVSLGVTAAGILLLFMGQYALGGALLGVGAAGLIGAAYLNLRQMVTGGLTAAHHEGRFQEEDRQTMERNQAEAGRLETAAEDFIRQYFPDGRPCQAALRELRDCRGEFLFLRQSRAQLQAEEKRLRDEAVQLETRLIEAMELYFPEKQRGDKWLEILGDRVRRITQLRREQREAEEETRRLREEQMSLSEEIAAFLQPYVGQADPENFGRYLIQLQQDNSEYARAEEIVKSWKSREERIRQQQEAIGAVWLKYGLEDRPCGRASLQRLQEDAHAWEKARSGRRQTQQALEEFWREHGRITEPVPEGTALPGQMEEKERELALAWEELVKQLHEKRSQLRELWDSVDEIPALEDELERWKEKQREGMAACELLDATIQLLEEAKESLSSSYLGPIRKSFSGYLSRFLGSEGEKSFVGTDLEVQLERGGQARELAYFSTGNVDIVMLCMRLALIDALFGDVRPFIILDDPFVNLDDVHTGQALQLLRQLGQDRQILYLVCHSSRNPLS